jgi:hypothetical protein
MSDYATLVLDFSSLLESKNTPLEMFSKNDAVVISQI